MIIEKLPDGIPKETYVGMIRGLPGKTAEA